MVRQGRAKLPQTMVNAVNVLLGLGDVGHNAEMMSFDQRGDGSDDGNDGFDEDDDGTDDDMLMDEEGEGEGSSSEEEEVSGTETRVLEEGQKETFLRA